MTKDGRTILTYREFKEQSPEFVTALTRAGMMSRNDLTEYIMPEKGKPHPFKQLFVPD